MVVYRPYTFRTSAPNEHDHFSIAANGILLIGSILMFEYGIKPGIGMMGFYFQIEQTEAHVTDSMEHLIYCFYHGLWILPIWILCYVCSILWYQDIADNTFKHIKVRSS